MRSEMGQLAIREGRALAARLARITIPTPPEEPQGGDPAEEGDQDARFNHDLHNDLEDAGEEGVSRGTVLITGALVVWAPWWLGIWWSSRTCRV